MKGEFYKTRDQFKNSIDFEYPLSYDEWLSVDDGYKVAVLYLEFFNEITLAWYKCAGGYATEEEGVETILQYLDKNVEKLRKNRRRYTANYIYRVAYNCLSCIAFARKCDKWEAENVVLAVQNSHDGTEYNLLDFVGDSNNSLPFEEEIRRRFWAEVEDLGEDTQTFVRNILEGDRLPTGFGGKKKKTELSEKLQAVLEKYKGVYYN